MWRLTSRLANHEPSNVAGNRVPYLQIGEHIGGTSTRTIRYSTSTVQYSTVQYSTAPPCRPPYIFLRQGGHPPVDPPPGYTRKYQDTHTRARTAAGCAVVKTGGTPPCRPPYIFLRQGGHPPVDPPPGYTRKYQDKHTRARTAAGCAVVKTGGTPPCRPPYILRRQGGHPPVDPPPGYTRRHTRHKFSYSTVPVRYCTSWGRRRRTRRVEVTSEGSYEPGTRDSPV